MYKWFFNFSMGIQIPAAWQGMPGQPLAAQQQLGQSLQQPGGMIGAYPMQQYQAQ